MKQSQLLLRVCVSPRAGEVLTSSKGSAADFRTPTPTFQQGHSPEERMALGPEKMFSDLGASPGSATHLNPFTFQKLLWLSGHRGGRGGQDELGD